MKYSSKILPVPDPKSHEQSISPRDPVWLKIWKEGSLSVAANMGGTLPGSMEHSYNS